MNRDDILRMARVAGCHDNGDEFRFVELRYLERFAALVVAAELRRLHACNTELVDALRKISSIDYRGNQSQESAIARAALAKAHGIGGGE